MNWTKKLPTRAGYYWNRRKRWGNEILVYVFERDGQLWYRRCDVLQDPYPITDLGGHWNGPQTAPQGECVED